MAYRAFLLLLLLCVGCTYEHKYRVGDKVVIDGFDEPLIITYLGLDSPNVDAINKMGQKTHINENLLKPYVQVREP